MVLSIIWGCACLFVTFGVVIYAETYNYNPIEKLLFGLLALFILACGLAPLLFV
jgi:uncharacterized membrane protein